MIARHLIVLATLATQVAVGTAGGLAYVCHMDGQVRSACCCPEHPNEQAGDTIVAAACCDVIAAERQERLDAELQAQGPLLGLAAHALTQRWDEGGAFASVDAAYLEAPLRGGPPLFIRIRTLLI